MNIATTFVKGLKTAQIVSLYNLVSEKPVTKFSDRATAEKRMSGIISEWDGHGNVNDAFKAFATKFYDKAKAAGIDFPAADLPATTVISDAANDKALKALESAAPVTPTDSATLAKSNAKPTKADPKGKKGDAPAPKPAKKAAPASGEAKKQNTPPHLNLRCPVCQYYAKSTPAMLKIARLTCPVDPKHGKLLTAEERGEKRGR